MRPIIQTLAVPTTIRFRCSSACVPYKGISFQTTYGWAKTLGLIPQGYTDPLNRDADYTEAYLSVKHDFHTNGTFELPIGPNKLLWVTAPVWWRGSSSAGR